MPSFGPLGLASFAPPSMELQPTRYASLPNLPCMPSLWFFGLASIGIATKEMRFPALHAMPLVLLGLASFTPPSLELQPKTNTHPCPIHPAMPSLWSFRGPLHVRATPSLWLFGLGYVCTSFCGIATRREIRDSTLPARRRTTTCTRKTISLALWPLWLGSLAHWVGFLGHFRLGLVRTSFRGIFALRLAAPFFSSILPSSFDLFVFPHGARTRDFSAPRCATRHAGR